MTQLNGRSILGVRIVGTELPVIFGQAYDVLRKKINEVEPIALISSGVAAGRAEINVERVAINVMDARTTPDNKGKRPRDEPIIKNGPAAYFTTLPFRQIVRDLTKTGIPAVVSNTAGTHLCNYAMYVGRHYVETEVLRIPAGFIHLPQTPDQIVGRHAMPSMSMDVITKALEVAARCTILSVRG